MHNPQLDQLTDYPFERLRALLLGLDPPAGNAPLDMAIGEPRHPPPAFVGPILERAAAGWGRYPPREGLPALRQAIAEWLERRYRLPPGMIDADRQIVPVSGTREALFMAALVAVPRRKGGRRPAVLMPNPTYQVYPGAAAMAGAEPILLPATADNGFQPDLTALPAEVLDRTALAYLNSPANPQGSVLHLERLQAAVALARRHDFVLAVDECYAEIYGGAPPAGALEACRELDGTCDGVLVFHSLSKRSNLPGLRSGFVAGDRRLVDLLKTLRDYGGAQVPLPVQEASAALWRDEDHVAANRALYRDKFDAAEAIFGAGRPGGGFYLWLDVGDGEAVARRLWQEAGLRVMPGAYLGRDAGGGNPGAPYIRAALVHSLARTEAALTRMRAVLDG